MQPSTLMACSSTLPSSICRSHNRIDAFQRQKHIILHIMKWRTGNVLLVTACLVAVALQLTEGRVAFEKLTDFDFQGTTYYSVKNLSLYECQGWCREEPDCQAAAFR